MNRPAPNPDPAQAEPFARFRRDHARVLADLAVLETSVLARPHDFEEAALHALTQHLDQQFATHMTAEDQVLFPALDVAFPEARGSLIPLREDHVELRGMLAALAGSLSLPRTPARDQRIVVLVRDFVDLIRLHVRKEESVVFDVAERVLSAPEVATLARRLAAFIPPEQHQAPE